MKRVMERLKETLYGSIYLYNVANNVLMSVLVMSLIVLWQWDVQGCSHNGLNCVIKIPFLLVFLLSPAQSSDDRLAITAQQPYNTQRSPVLLI